MRVSFCFHSYIFLKVSIPLSSGALLNAFEQGFARYLVAGASFGNFINSGGGGDQKKNFQSQTAPISKAEYVYYC